MDIITSEKPGTPGAFRMSAAAYHGDPCPEPSLSNSLAQLFLDASPNHVRHAHPKLNPYWRPDTGTRRTALGSACHALLLGKGAEIDSLDYRDYKKNEAKAARDAALAAGKIPMLKADLGKAQAIVAAAKKQLAARGLEDLADGNGDAEVAIIANDAGLWTRCLIDFWSRDRFTLFDYKTTAALASPAAFAVTVSQMGYDFQDSWYRRCTSTAFPELAGRLDFVFAVQEIEPPFALSACRISGGDRTVADRKVETALSMWRECLGRNRWPGYPSEVQEIQLPEWHTRRWLDREMGEDANPQWQFAGER